MNKSFHGLQLFFFILVLSSCSNDPLKPLVNPAGLFLGDHTPVSSFSSVQILGGFNSWNKYSSPELSMMSLSADHVRIIQLAFPAGSIEFKFVVNQDWNYAYGNSTGLTGTATYYPGTGSGSSLNIKAVIPVNGTYIITLNETTGVYQFLYK